MKTFHIKNLSCTNSGKNQAFSGKNQAFFAETKPFCKKYAFLKK
jgi:hypothetical protein